MGIAETLEYIHNVKWRGRKPGLSRTRELLDELGSPDKSLRFVHIAGTNGKGSTAACIASVLRKAGYRTGLYTSPYIERFNERMQIDGEHIPDAELVRLTGFARPFADAMADSPTEFELITAIAMRHFLDCACDIVVLEVGLGGELDSTNIIDTPEVAVITSIGYDHEKELGPTLRDIAGAKAGIIKDGGDVVIYGGVPEVEEVFERVSAKRGARLHRADFSRISRLRLGLDGARFVFEPYGEIVLPLAGVYQPKNAAVAITALEVLGEKGFGISAADIAEGLAAARWPGRFEALGRSPVFILDGAHNPQGMEAAADSLRHIFRDRKIVFMVGVMADKEVDSMISQIAPLADCFVAVRPDNPRSLDTRTLTQKLSRFGVSVTPCDTITDAVAEAIGRAGEGGIVCSLGSLYHSGAVRAAYFALDYQRKSW